MRPKKKQKTRASGTESRIFDSMGQAAAALGVPLHRIKAAKRAGCSAFRGARVYESELMEFLASIPEAPDDDQKSTADWVREVKREDALMRRVKRQRLEGTLVSRSWVCERIQLMCGELAALQARSEGEHPVRLAAAGDDVAGNRAVLREIWDEIRDMLQGLGEHLREADPE